MKAGSAKKLVATCFRTVSVTIRYIRLKHARPSVGGRMPAIARIRAVASSIDPTGSTGRVVIHADSPTAGMLAKLGPPGLRRWSPPRRAGRPLGAARPRPAPTSVLGPPAHLRRDDPHDV